MISFFKNYIFIILVDFNVSLSRFFCYPDRDQRFQKWIRIRPNDTDPTRSGSEALVFCVSVVSTQDYDLGVGNQGTGMGTK